MAGRRKPKPSRGRGRPPVAPDGTARDVELRVRVTAAERALIASHAARLGLDVSAYVRSRALWSDAGGAPDLPPLE